MKRSVLAAVFLLFGCTVRQYREALAASPKYSVAMISDCVALINEANGERTGLPMCSRKLSWPVLDRARFSADGRLLFVPLRHEGVVSETPSYTLLVWDIDQKTIARTVDIDASEW